MLKKLILMALFVEATVASYGQGTVIFSTSSVGARVSLDGAWLGTNNTGGLYYAQLFAADGTGQPQGDLSPVGNPVNFNTGVDSGFVMESGTPVGAAVNVPVNPIVAVTAVNGGPVTLQMRVWSSTYADYNAASSAIMGGAPGIFGQSSSFSLNQTGVPEGFPSPVNLVGLQSFGSIPEPTTYAVAGLGAGIAWMLRRRRV